MRIKVYIFLFILTLLYFFDYLIFKKTLISSNATLDFLGNGFPLYFTNISFLKKGIFPLWNPSIMCGIPFFVTGRPSAFSIFEIFGFFTKPVTAYMLALLFQVFFAEVCMFLYLNKGLKLGIKPSLLGAVIFAFNPLFLFSLPHYAAEPATIVLLPLVFLFFEFSIQQRKVIYSLLAGLILSLTLYNGVGYMYLYSCLFLLIYGLCRIYGISKDKKERIYNLSFLIGAIIVSILLSSAQIIPTIEIFKLSHRGGEHLSEGIFISHLAGIFFPFGSLRIAGSEIGTLRNIYVFYAGTASIFLMVVSLSLIRKDYFAKIFALLALTLLMILLLIRYTPLKLYLSHISPVFNTLGFQRLEFLYHFLMAGLAALGLDAIEKNKIKYNRLLFIGKFINLLFVFYLAIIVAFVFIWLGKNIFKDQAVSMLQTAFNRLLLNKYPYTQNADYYLKKFSYIYEQLFLPSFAILIIIALLSRLLSLAFLSKIFKGAKRIPLAFIFLVYIDLISVNRIFTNPFSYDYYKAYEPGTKEALFLKAMKPTERMGIKINYYSMDYSKADFKAGHDKELADLGPHNLGLNYNIPTVFGASLAGGMDPLYLKRLGEFVEIIHKDDPNYAARLQLRRPQHVIEFTSIDSRLIDLLGIKYIFSISELKSPKIKFLFKGKEYYVYENLKVLPRVFFVEGIKVASSGREVLRELGRKEFDPSKEAILEENPLYQAEALSKGSFKNNISAGIISYKPNRVIISASNNREGFLVLTDSYYPGWKAFIDGRPAKVYAADYIFRAVLVPKGTHHKIEFIYKPFSFYSGLFLSVSTLFIMIFIFIYRFIKDRARKTY